jgi:hypothetical protein
LFQTWFISRTPCSAELIRAFTPGFAGYAIADRASA